MPKLKKDIDRQCWACRFYQIHTPGGPFCLHWKKYFPNPTGWAHGDGTKPGERSCPKWAAKN